MTLTPNTQIAQDNVGLSEDAVKRAAAALAVEWYAGGVTDQSVRDEAATQWAGFMFMARAALIAALSPPAEGIGMAANEVGAWIAKRDSEYEAALADLTQPPCIDSLDDFGRTIYSALEDCPAMSVDKQADFIARAFWPLISAPAPAPAPAPVDHIGDATEKMPVDWERVGPKLVEALDGIVHFTDGFGFYRTQSPAGIALEQWIDEADSLLKEIDADRGLALAAARPEGK